MKSNKKCTLGVLAHVDSGKTTLSEAMLYESATIRTFGRVDHQNSFLDYDLQERKRGITIYLKQAVFSWKNTTFTLIDTPGHTDFSAEMERTLQVLDYAILLISGLDGVQAHTKTIWKLLETYQIPCFIFINKMDLSFKNENELLDELKSEFSENCIPFQNNKEETCALINEEMLESYTQKGIIPDELYAKAIAQRQLFPVFFGSALKQEGISSLLDSLSLYTQEKEYSDEFGAKIFKISRDSQGNRLTHLKITGGTLKAKSIINEEKIDQIRIYSGNKFIMVNEAVAGDLCCLKGPQHLQIQNGLGFEHRGKNPILSPCLEYKLSLPQGIDSVSAYRQLKQLEEENPELHLSSSGNGSEIHIELMGEIQTEILKVLIQERFGWKVEFGQGQIHYLETIKNPIEGIGHYEPLRHYSEVHLLLEPLPLGSGLVIDSTCPVDLLAAPWQKQVLSTLDDTELLGVLCRCPLTDMKITLLTGKAHNKHTESGDFRQATLRALHQGLRSTECQLLEPIYRFEMEIPTESLSRALFDLDNMKAEVTVHQEGNEKTRCSGIAPVATLQNYQTTLATYTKGLGTLTCFMQGYKPCHNQEEVIQTIHYEPDHDLENSADSVFCSHGAGTVIPWYEVDQHMHLERVYQATKIDEKPQSIQKQVRISDEEIDAVMKRTYKQKEKPTESIRIVAKEMPEHITVKKQEKKVDCLLVDGYNMIYSWDSLKELAELDLAASRDKLTTILANYHGYRKGIIILVFDAYKQEQNPGSIQKNKDFYIVYTKTSETADSTIEKATHHLAKEYRVTVATSDGMEQRIILGSGGLRLSARELENLIHSTSKSNTAQHQVPQNGHRPLEELRNKYKEENEE